MGKINSVIEFTGKTGNLVGVKGQDGEVYLRKRLRRGRAFRIPCPVAP